MKAFYANLVFIFIGLTKEKEFVKQIYKIERQCEGKLDVLDV